MIQLVMAVSEEQRERNRDREADPAFVARIMRQGARKTARENVIEAVREVVRAGPPDWFQDYQAATYQAEVQRLLSRI